MPDRPISDHAMLSDSHSAALVDTDGAVVWWCPPRFDGPSVFGRLLDAEAGYFRIRPAADATVERRYVDGSLVLATRFTTADGVLEVTDALALGPQVREHRLGVGSPHTLLRRAECIAGRVEVVVEFCPRFEYGLTRPLVLEQDGGLVARGGAAMLQLVTGCPLTVESAVARGTVTLAEGEQLTAACAWSPSWEEPRERWDHDKIVRRIDDTVTAWRSWGAQHQRYTGPYADMVEVSGRVLQGLTFQPTGAIVAAATTSLPETVGGERNWDYRYAWLRDASFTLNALWVAACPDEARTFLRWLTTAASTFEVGGDLQIMFGVGGERDLTERELDHLDGWRGSSPVRVGNGAWQQRQIDVYGELLDAVHRLRQQMTPFSAPQQRFLIKLADKAAQVWRQTDQGIWEIRGEPQHYLYSKLMCWVAVDRALRLADELDADGHVAGWERAREEIRHEILDRGWNADVGAFTQTLGGHSLDASNLVIPLVGFLPPDDDRVRATIAATERSLTDRYGLVYRYRTADGLAGDEGTFLLCTFWLAEAHALAGDVGRARTVFDAAAAWCNDVGLLSEEVDPDEGALIGNFPQAFSHIGLINAAWAIAQATATD